MLHQETQQAQRCHDDHIVVVLLTILIGQQKLGVVLINGDLENKRGRENSLVALPFGAMKTSKLHLLFYPHLSNVELQECKVCMTGNFVEAKDPIDDPPPNLDEAVSDGLTHVPQPGTHASQLSPHNVHHVVFIVFLL